MDEKAIQTVFAHYIELFPQSAAVAIANRDEFVFYYPGKDNILHIRPGTSINTEPITLEAVVNRRPTEGRKRADDSNETYIARSIPIIEGTNVIGAITAIESAKQQMAPFLTVKTSDRWVPLHYNDVIYMEAQHRKTHVISMDTKGVHRNNLTELQRILPIETFFRSHRSYIINVHYIKEIHPDSHSSLILIMANLDRVPVSKSYAREFRSMFNF